MCVQSFNRYYSRVSCSITCLCVINNGEWGTINSYVCKSILSIDKLSTVDTVVPSNRCFECRNSYLCRLSSVKCQVSSVQYEYLKSPYLTELRYDTIIRRYHTYHKMIGDDGSSCSCSCSCSLWCCLSIYLHLSSLCLS